MPDANEMINFAQAAFALNAAQLWKKTSTGSSAQ